MEVSENNAKPDISTVNGWVFKLIFVLGTLFAVAIVALFLFDSKSRPMGYGALAGTIIFFLCGRLAWGIGNWVRKFVAPDAYLTSGVRDAFNKRVFWLIGPQWAAISGLWLFGLILLPFATDFFVNNKKTPAMTLATVVDSAPVQTPISVPVVDNTPVQTSTSAPTVEALAPATPTSAIPSTTTSAQSQLSAGFVVVAPEESKQLLTSMLFQATSAFKISEIKGNLEALPKPANGDRKAARKLNEQGLAALKSEDFSLALSSLKSAVAADPADVEVLNNYVYALIKGKRLQDAESEAGRLLTISPGRSSAWANLAEVYAVKNNKDEAVAALILAFQFSSNKDRTITFLNDQAGDSNSPMQSSAKKAIEVIQKM